MASQPFFLVIKKAIAAGGGTASFSYNVPQLQTLHIETLQFVSTGIFSIYSMRNANGRQYTNATQADGLLSDFLQKGASPNIGLLKLPYELVIAGGDSIIIDIIDTSAAANTITLLLAGSLDLGA